MNQSEIQERAARLNTQLRFGRHQGALAEAYRLRAFIQLCGYQNEETTRELQRAEVVIAELEKKQVSGVQKLVDSIVRTLHRSLNPENDTDHDSLLDRFEEKRRASAANEGTQSDEGAESAEQSESESSESGGRRGWLGDDQGASPEDDDY